MSQAKCFRVVGVHRKNGQDVDIRVEALKLGVRTLLNMPVKKL